MADLHACPTPRKRRFSSKRDAQVMLARATLLAVRLGQREGEYPQRVYRCPCGGWHLTHWESPPAMEAARG